MTKTNIIPLQPRMDYEKAKEVVMAYKTEMFIMRDSLGVLMKSKNILERMLDPKLYEGREEEWEINKDVEMGLAKMVKEGDIILAYNFLDKTIDSMLKGIQKKYPQYDEALIIVNNAHEENRRGNK